MRIRVRFTKNECIKYLGHLDIMRAFQKCMNRAGISMVYSEGFNPHQKISFALPLSVGFTSEAEYMDALVEDGQDVSEILRKLQKVSGPGFDIINVRRLKEDAAKAMAAVRYAAFEVCTPEHAFSEDEINDFLSQTEILCLKKTKKGERTENIRPQIQLLQAKSNFLYMQLSAGSESNLKPELILNALYEHIGFSFDKDEIRIKRKELYAEGLVPLDSYETEVN